MDHLHGIAFTDATHGCIAGATGVSYTGDAGEHWTKGAEGDFMDVAFADSRRGFAVGLHPAAFQTDNGGASWRPLTLPGHRPHDWLVSVRFSDPQHGWIVGFNDGQQLRSLEGQDGTIVYRTTNGGLDWKRMGGEVKVCATDIWFEDADHGFLCGEQRDGPEVGVIYESKDAGEHWTKVPLELKGIPRCLNQGLGCTDQGEILRLRK